MESNDINIALDLVSVAYMIILLVSMHLSGRTGTEKDRIFGKGVLTLILCLLVDTAAWIMDEFPQDSLFKHIVNTLAVCTGEVLAIFFAYYVLKVIADSTDVPGSIYRSILITNVLGIAGIVILDFAGAIFSIENGTYQEGWAYDFIAIPVVVAMICMLVFIIYKMNDLGRRSALTLIMYIAPSALAIIIEDIIGVPLALVAFSMSLLMVYITFQSFEVAEVRIRTRILDELANVDTLTGMNNRHVFEETMDRFETGPDVSVGVVFCDVNALKYTNDAFGHDAGDELLKRFAALFEEHFSARNCYRISGDEFVAICELEETEFTALANGFLSKMMKNNYIASVGFSAGKAGKIRFVEKVAEDKMYEEKEKYYKTPGYNMKRR